MSKPKCHKIIAETGSGRPYPKITAIITARPLTHHFVTVKSMFTKKSLFNIFYIRQRKPESDTDLRDDTQVKKRKFCPKWLEEFQWLKYDQTKNKWRVEFVLMHMAVNLNHHKVLCMHQITSSAQVTQHHSGKDHIMAMNIINRRRSHNMVVYHIQAKASMPLKAQLKIASVMGKKKIPDRKFNALIDLQVS